MKKLSTRTTAVALVAFAGLGGSSFGMPSDPSLFSTVYNIGTVPTGSIFDVPFAVTGTQVGDGDTGPDVSFITPTFLTGNTLGSDSQLNVFDGGMISGFFDFGPIDGSGSNIEANFLGGYIDERLRATGSSINVAGGSIREIFLNTSTLDISSGSILLGFNAQSGSVVNMSGGEVGFFFARTGAASIVNVSGGSIPVGFSVDNGSEVNVSGGSIGTSTQTNPVVTVDDATLNITGGSVEGRIRMEGLPGARPRLSITGGSVGAIIYVGTGTLTITGGDITNYIDAGSSAEIHLTGTKFALDGMPIPGLATGSTVTINQRDVTLTGILTDGSAFDYELNSVRTTPPSDYLDMNSILTVTLVCPADINGDGTTVVGDILDFLGFWSASDPRGDWNNDGVYALGDILDYIGAWSAGCP